jgi:hypothetical protein
VQGFQAIRFNGSSTFRRCASRMRAIDDSLASAPAPLALRRNVNIPVQPIAIDDCFPVASFSGRNVRDSSANVKDRIRQQQNMAMSVLCLCV